MSAQFEVKDGFILPACYKLFQFLRLISVFTLIRFINLKFWELRNHEKYDPKHVPIKCRPVTKRYVFSEAWALGNLVASILAGTCAYLIPWALLQIVILCYAVIRTLELFVYQVNVLLFDPLTNPQTYAIKSATRMVILLIMNMIEYTFWFSCVYSCLCFLVEGMMPEGFVFVLESFNQMTNLSSPADISVVHFQILAFFETLVGMFMNLVCLARFIGLLPSVRTIDDN